VREGSYADQRRAISLRGSEFRFAEMAQRRLLSTAALAAAVPVGRSREGASKTLQRIAFGGPFLPNTASSVYVGLM
jgi:hypothetical protein